MVESNLQPRKPGLHHRIRHRARQTYHRHKKSFLRANGTAIAATVVDFGTLVALVEVGGVYYVWATAIGAVAGALTNFTLNRIWAFDHDGRHYGHQAWRYSVVSGGSLLLNTLLVFLFTDFGGLRYQYSKILAALVVGWFWNYPLHRHFVFRRKDA